MDLSIRLSVNLLAGSGWCWGRDGLRGLCRGMLVVGWLRALRSGGHDLGLSLLLSVERIARLLRGKMGLLLDEIMALEILLGAGTTCLDSKPVLVRESARSDGSLLDDLLLQRSDGGLLAVEAWLCSTWLILDRWLCVQCLCFIASDRMCGMALLMTLIWGYCRLSLLGLWVCLFATSSCRWDKFNAFHFASSLYTLCRNIFAFTSCGWSWANWWILELLKLWSWACNHPERILMHFACFKGLYFLCGALFRDRVSSWGVTSVATTAYPLSQITILLWISWPVTLGLDIIDRWPRRVKNGVEMWIHIFFKVHLTRVTSDSLGLLYLFVCISLCLLMPSCRLVCFNFQTLPSVKLWATLNLFHWNFSDCWASGVLHIFWNGYAISSR